MGLNNYIVIGGLNISPYFTILEWVNDINTAVATRSQYFNLKDSINDNFSCSRWTTYNNIGISKNGDFSEGGGNFIGYPGVNTGALGFNCRSYVSVQSKNNYVRQNNATTSPYLTSITPQNITDIWLGAVRKTNGTTPTDYSSANMLHSLFMLYNREISLAEYTYFYANKLGNEPMSMVGVEIFLKNNKAEVINIAGVDQPCVRDYSGNNRHGIIMNLPAGTAQQKVDYANTNLFVPFI